MLITLSGTVSHTSRGNLSRQVDLILNAMERNIKNAEI